MERQKPTAVSNLTWPAYNGIIGGIGAQFVMPRTRQQFSLFTDLLYSHFSSTTPSYAVNSANMETGYIYYNYLQLDILFRYQMPRGKVRPFVNAGIRNTLNLGINSYLDDHEIGVATDTRTSIFGTPLPNGGNSNPSPYVFGVMGGAGFTIGRFSVEARFQASDGITSGEGVDAPMKDWYVMAGFSF